MLSYSPETFYFYVRALALTYSKALGIFMFSDQMLVRGKVVLPCANDKVRTLKASIFRLGCSVCYVRPGLISSADPPSAQSRGQTSA